MGKLVGHLWELAESSAGDGRWTHLSAVGGIPDEKVLFWMAFVTIVVVGFV